ncbi:MAG: hypothetical protein ASARMPRED_006403 [Alectoria sarmentosa]|nr:MAG: hypothetical protein ASARMPRED_006403 [Alectoria sarmentosa]
MINHKKPLKVKLPPSLPPINPSSQRRKRQSSILPQPATKPHQPSYCYAPYRLREECQERHVARIADGVADEEEALSRSENDDTRSTHEFSLPTQKSTDESLVDNDDLADHDKRRKDALPYQDRPGEAPTHGEAAQDGLVTTAETDTNDHVTQQGPDRKSIQQKQTADTYMEVSLSRGYCLQTATAISFVMNVVTGVSYQGTSANGVEQFQNISYAEDTSGANPFAPPVSYLPTRSMA